MHLQQIQKAVDKDWIYRFVCGFQCLLGLNDFSNMME